MANDRDLIDRGVGAAIVCLHGFPQNMHVWDELGDHLVDAGFRVIAPNQRGYKSNSVLEGRRQYTSACLAADIVALLDELDIPAACIVGHDLGATVAWEVARLAPERVTRVVSMSAPHPAAFLQACISSTQLLRAWYVIGAQSLTLAAALFSPRKLSSARRLVAFLSARGLKKADAAEYADYLSGDRRFEGALRWYQAMPFSSLRSTWTKATVPATVIWGICDPFTNGRSIDLTARWTLAKCSTHRLPDAGHWLPDYNAESVAKILVRELGG